MTVEAEAPEVDFGDDDDGAQAFFENLTGTKEAPAEAPEAVEGEEVVEGPENPEAPVEGAEAPVVPPEDDEGEVELSFGDDKRKVSVKDIKRLMEAETSISTKTASAVAAEAASQAVTQRAELALKSMLERAQASFEPYSKLNFLALAKDPNVSAEVLETVQKEAQAAFDAVQYFQTELNDVTSKATAARHATMQAEAGEAVKVLQDPKSPNHITGFNKDVYEGLVAFATSLGMDQERVRGITNPAHLKMIDMAMQFQKGQQAARTKVAKVIVKPTRVLKPSASTSGNSARSQSTTDALTRLRRSGSEEDAAAAFEASFRNKD